MASQSDGRFIEATDYVRKSASTDAKHAEATESEIYRQERSLRDWANKTGRLIPPERFKALHSVSNCTSEHTVYFDAARNRAVKVTFPGEFGWVPTLDRFHWNLGVATPLDYLLRWQLFNEVFGDDVCLEGISLLQESASVSAGKAELVSVVISQRWHEAADPAFPAPIDEEVSTFLLKLAFEPLIGSFGGWRRSIDGVVVLDAFPDNFIKTKSGIMPIDLPITQEKPD